MSDHKEEAWSRSKDDGFSHDSLGDLLDNYGDELNVGDTVYVGEAHRPTASDLCSASDIIDMIGERGHDIGGEYADDFPSVSKEAEAELEALLHGWVDKHCLPANFYEVKNVREYVLTADDLQTDVPPCKS